MGGGKQHLHSKADLRRYLYRIKEQNQHAVTPASLCLPKSQILIMQRDVCSQKAAWAETYFCRSSTE